MQKKIIALAVAGLMSSAAFAQTNVTISGAVEAHFEHVSAGGASDGGQNATSRTRITDNTSWLRFSGSESLGNGLTAFFQIESDLYVDNASQATGGSNVNGFGKRNSAVGLKGAFGTVLLGHWDAHYNAQLEGGVDFGSAGALAHSANSMNLTSQVDGMGNIGGRLSNVVAYITPDFSGLSARIAYTAGSESTLPGLAAKDNGWNLFAKYGNGPINAFWSHLEVNNSGASGTSTGADIKSDKLGAAYTLPMGLKIGLVYDRTKVNDGTGSDSRKAWSLPISYSMGNHGMYFAFAKAGDFAGSSTGAKNTILGYTYSLSKRTQVGVSYSVISNETAANYDFWTRGVGNVANGADPKSFAVGVNHAF